MAQAEKMMVDPSYNRQKRKEKLAKEEEELEALMKQMQEGVSGDDDQPEEQEAESKGSGEETTDGGVGEQPEDKESSEESKQEDTSEDKEEEAAEPKTKEEKTFKKRYGDLRRHLAKKEKEWQERFEKLESTSPQVVPPKSDEDLEAWAEKYPDVAGIVHTIAEKKAKDIVSGMEERLKEFDEAQYEAKQLRAETEIKKKHKDFDTLRDSDEFHEWAEAQPKWVQDALYENADDAASVIRVIDLYKVDKGLTPSANKQKAKEAAKSVSTSDKPKVDPDEGNKKIRESDVAKWSDKEFEERWDEIKEAQINGNFVYDLSGGAR